MLSEFKVELKSRIKIGKNENLFLFIGSKILTDNEKLSDVYEKHKNPEDNLLYLSYSDV